MKRTFLISSVVGMLLGVEAHATVARIPEPSVWALLAGVSAVGVIIKRLKFSPTFGHPAVDPESPIAVWLFGSRIHQRQTP